jgi:hypothetical protein
MHRIKRPAQKSKGRIKPRVPSSTNDLNPVFCLHYLDSKYGLGACQGTEIIAFAHKLHELSQMTWEQILFANRHGLGSELIAARRIKGRIPPEFVSAVDFIAVRFEGKKPMVGERKNQIFHIIWLDRDFTLYDH